MWHLFLIHDKNVTSISKLVVNLISGICVHQTEHLDQENKDLIRPEVEPATERLLGHSCAKTTWFWVKSRINQFTKFRDTCVISNFYTLTFDTLIMIHYSCSKWKCMNIQKLSFKITVFKNMFLLQECDSWKFINKK